MARYSAQQHDRYAADFERDGFVILKSHFDVRRLASWAEAFAPLLQAAVDDPKKAGARGKQRYYVTLPFEGVFADPHFFDDDDVLAVVERVAGADPVMCQLASDTPLNGSEYQMPHRDTPALFPELTQTEVPSYQLAVNFPLCAVTLENGPLDTARGTHRMTRPQAMAAMERGDAPLESLTLDLGDVIVRDVRGIHRGTPNRTDVPRPMIVIGYSRHWYHRPEVHVDIPQATWETLPPRARRLLRYNPIVSSLSEAAAAEPYQAFAY